MKLATTVFGILLAVATTACGGAATVAGDDGDDAISPDAIASSDGDGSLLPGDGGTIDAAPAPDADPYCRPVTIYLNNEGETFRPGFENPLTNRSAILDTAFTATPLSPAQFSAVTAFLESKLAEFDPIIVTERPAADVPYAMIVVSTTWPEDIYLEPFMYQPICGQVEYRRIGFVGFEASNTFALRLRTTLQMVGRVAGLDRTATTCMSIAVDGDVCTFEDGVDVTGPHCSGTTQNEREMLELMFSCQGGATSG